MRTTPSKPPTTLKPPGDDYTAPPQHGVPPPVYGHGYPGWYGPPPVQGPMISGFTVNKPPVYGLQGLRDEHKIKFAKEYIVYARKQDTMSVSGGVSIGTVTMGACMTQEALAHHARFDFHGRPIRDIQEHEWEAMFEAALKIPAQNKSMVIARLRGIAMDEKLLRVGDRMTEWQSAYLKILVAEGAEDIDYFHPKPVIQALMAGIRPAGVKALVKEAYDFDNKAIKGNIAAFWEFVRSKLEQVLPAMEAAENAARVKALNKRRGDICCELLREVGRDRNGCYSKERQFKSE